MIKNPTITASYQMLEAKTSSVFYYLLDNNGFLHHDSLPALKIIDLFSETHYYYHHGILYRKNAPAIKVKSAVTSYDFHEKKELKKDFSFLSFDKLILLAKLDDKKVFLEKKEMLLYNSEEFSFGPSHVYIVNKKITYCYLKDGILHRTDGPARLSFDETGLLLKEQWYLEGRAI